jgi:formylglycine-generating enzyme required for sulfatase activity
MSRSGRSGVPAALLALAAAAGSGCERTGAPSGSGATPPVIRTAAGIEMVLIPAGTFEMGSTRGKPDEAPVHTVRVDAFLLDRTEVTQEQFAKLEMPDPSHFKDRTNPVEQVNWPQAVLFCNRRSEAEGLQPCYNEETAACDFQAAGYRLPTEAEWEYACRAGTTTDYSFGSDPRRLDAHAWFADNARKKTHPVGRKRPNPWWLFDMHGNVGEWCHDTYDRRYYAKSPEENPRGPADGKLYVLRGGAWTSRPGQLRSSARMGDNPGFADACLARDAIGFRCVRKPPADLPGGASAGTK